MDAIKFFAIIFLFYGYCNAATVMIITDNASSALQYLNFGSNLFSFDVRPGISYTFTKNDVESNEKGNPIFFGLDASTNFNLDKNENLCDECLNMRNDEENSNEEIPERDIEKDSSEGLDFLNTDTEKDREKAIKTWYETENKIFYNKFENDKDLAKNKYETNGENQITEQINDIMENRVNKFEDLEKNLELDKKVIPWFYKPENHDEIKSTTEDDTDNSNEITTTSYFKDSDSNNLEENLNSEKKIVPWWLYKPVKDVEDNTITQTDDNIDNGVGNNLDSEENVVPWFYKPENSEEEISSWSSYKPLDKDDDDEIFKQIDDYIANGLDKSVKQYDYNNFEENLNSDENVVTTPWYNKPEQKIFYDQFKTNTKDEILRPIDDSNENKIDNSYEQNTNNLEKNYDPYYSSNSDFVNNYDDSKMLDDIIKSLDSKQFQSLYQLLKDNNYQFK